MYNIKYRKVLTSARWESRKPNKGKLEERGSGQETLIHASSTRSDQLQQGQHGPDCRSGHEDPGLFESNPASTYDKTS